MYLIHLIHNIFFIANYPVLFRLLVSTNIILLANSIYGLIFTVVRFKSTLNKVLFYSIRFLIVSAFLSFYLTRVL